MSCCSGGSGGVSCSAVVVVVEACPAVGVVVEVCPAVL